MCFNDTLQILRSFPKKKQDCLKQFKKKTTLISTTNIAITLLITVKTLRRSRRCDSHGAVATTARVNNLTHPGVQLFIHQTMKQECFSVYPGSHLGPDRPVRTSRVPANERNYKSYSVNTKFGYSSRKLEIVYPKRK